MRAAVSRVSVSLVWNESLPPRVGGWFAAGRSSVEVGGALGSWAAVGGRPAVATSR